MYKVAISGKAGSGKNTLSKILITNMMKSSRAVESVAFADPIKEIVRKMFPQLPRKFLYGPSKFRAEVIPDILKHGDPVTVRQVLIDVGTNGRKYNENIWVDAFENKFNKYHKRLRMKSGLFVVTDTRFRNEFERLKKLGFYQIRLLRDDQLKINDASETNQDSINDSEFDCVLINNGSLSDLGLEVKKIISQLKP